MPSIPLIVAAVLCHSPDVFSQGTRLDLQSIEDPELRDLASTLPSIVIPGKAPATIKKYGGAFGRWKRWATDHPKVLVLPAKPMYVALYLSYLAQVAKTPAPLEEAVNVLSWVHRMATVEDMTAHPLVQQVFAGAKLPIEKRAYYGGAFAIPD